VFSNIAKDGSNTAKINWDTSKNTAGDHKIFVRIDPSGNIRERNETNNIANQSIHINAIPTLNAFIYSDNSVFRTQNITISANATDAETPSNQIECELLYKHSSLGDEPLNWSIITKRKYNVNGECWDYVFEPGSDWKLGSYSFQVQFEDTDTGLSNWHKSANAVNVKNNAPSISDLWLTEVNYTRMDKVTIHLDAIDIEDLNDVDPVFQYRHTTMVSGAWNTITSENITQLSSSSTVWEAYILLNTSVKLGLYDIKIEITDNDDTTASQDLIEAFNVVNVGPDINAIYISSAEVYRTNSLYINVDVDDLEDQGPDLTCEIQYTMQIAPVEEDWDSLYVAEIHWDSTENMFQGRFHPTPSSPVGIYYVRARVSDDDGEVSNWLEAIDYFEVKNNLPVISMEDFPATVNEDDEVNFDASNTSDIESKLLYYIWDFGDGSAFSADKVTTHTFSKSGIFNISLTVEDQDKGSSVVYKTIEVKNVLPIAEGYVDKDTAVVGETITFYGEKSYDTASNTNLTYIWDFDDGSDPEEGKVVSHTYTNAARYFVTLTVIDDNEEESEKDTIMVVINEDDGSGDNVTGTTDDGFDMFTWGIIIIGIILIIAISMLFIWLRKKNEKDQKLANAVKPKMPGAPEDLDEPDVISRPGAMAVSGHGAQPGLETPTVTVVTPTVVGSGQEQQYDETSIYEPTLPGAAGSVGTLPDEKTKKSKKKGGEEPEVITPDIEYAPEVPTELDIAPGQTAELPKGKSNQPTEVLIPEELGTETPTVVPTVAETPQGSKPTKKLKKRAPKVVKK
jgi:PKD repeat protein